MDVDSRIGERTVQLIVTYHENHKEREGGVYPLSPLLNPSPH